MKIISYWKEYFQNSFFKMGDEFSPLYHEIKIPLLDLYQDGEDEPFRKLQRDVEDERNLVIFPSEYRHSLVPERAVKRTRVRTVPGTGALEYLSQYPVVHSNEEFAIFRVSEGLDVAYMKNPNFLTEPDLNNRVFNLFGKKPIIITASEDELLHYPTLGIQAEKPRDFILTEAEIVTRGRIQGTDNLCAKLYESPAQEVELEQARELMKKQGDLQLPKLYPNQFVEFIGAGGAAYAIVSPRLDKVKLLKIPGELNYQINQHQFSSTAGIKPRNIEQYLAVQYGLLDPNIRLAFLCGSYGSGKTVLAFSAGLDQILVYPEEIQRKRELPFGKARRGAFRQIAIFRPNDPIGGRKRELAAVPGNLWEKTRHQFGSFISAHEALRSYANFSFEELLKHPDRTNEVGDKRSEGLKIGEGSLPQHCEAIKLYSFADIQGCNFEDLFVIIDEAENFTHDELKALLSRQCPNTKIVVLGDPFQVVNPECTKDRNGLTSAVRHFLPYDFTSLFNLTINNRGPVSRAAESWKS